MDFTATVRLRWMLRLQVFGVWKTAF